MTETPRETETEITTQRERDGIYVHGSTMRHILVLTATSSVGLMALFMVDLIDMYFLSLLGEVEVAAAIGYAGSILFFTVSVGIGLSIAASALVARALGERLRSKARRITTHSLLYATILSTVIAVIVWIFVPELLSLLGASGRTHDLATSYLRIIVPAMPFMSIGICASAILRALGDPKRSMYVTLAGGIINALFDPLLIFTFGLGVDGAAWASVLARLTVMLVGLYGLITVHKALSKPKPHAYVQDAKAITTIALPAILTNVATPVGNAYVTYAIAPFGDSAVAGWAIIGRIIPVTFAGIFSVSGAVGPVIGQNLGAEKYGRVRQSMNDALTFTTIYTLGAWLILAIASPYIVAAFDASQEASNLISLFCIYLTPLFAFFGAMYVANAAFNNLGRAHYSALFNWARATLGTIPFVYFGAQYFGASGVIAGNMAGAVLFGLASVIVCYRLIHQVELHGEAALKSTTPRLTKRIPIWPFSTPRG